ncbi:MAG: bifunctional ornithine acetyltransferase/N-acetylglutamate synthase [Omnitrophica bacterium RIFCSPLOWO2_12_FULL_44_17]|uniref:Arginine biosynthesis bifunctional protein ArgJ n=1 Tax=Candidatus Danuiimicrobium aquiferis TaxID=1801832 RepID=A0A1G1L1N9_9BACT|nr:MAG: bifunctional ornithine acetyltransferase/N-acetylglutamate synthase [Omnitrophica bacterium RIFCSPHIGHO2_02_FULL_45_28]OGW88932.1 MAG: bifunctional ornithine acetyltransferase/N-acetylglutamate synthase [Omnitrophica bacterium RIFCSPHIGHO2_12_FULL_44_12]OGW99070.1 MAG: bifunctional ornithine acetyltransferase/N-acetylglutamate synthase [Omnitrophica bacterium RIFCSPLOWO2_12_FULL_44_17]OGX02576.1 MAG: bifunctional ornithine acetyltransferase/N-acetylglutamate synthase [Omnitrophica bacter
MKVVPNGSVTSPQGFKAFGMYAGIKKNARKYDVSLICSDVPAVSAGTFTTSKVKAWPLQYNLKIMKNKTHRAIFGNSGNANCFNGIGGKKAVGVVAGLLARRLKIKRNQIFMNSTGIIGRSYPTEVVENALPQLVSGLSYEGGHEAARGILTTDTHPKEIAVRFSLHGKPVTVAAMAKGAGMMYPDMNVRGESPNSIKGKHATMLCFVTTDANISKRLLERALENVIRKTFNKIAIDNDQSTNDTVLILANGLAGNQKIVKQDQGFLAFESALLCVCEYIAKHLLKDGEGVTHVCEIIVKGAKTGEEGNQLCRQIATSMLVKTMLAGEDPNWGRLMGCVGSSQVAYSPELDIAFDGVPIIKNGCEVAKNKLHLRQCLKKKEYVLEIDLKKGRYEERFWTTDLTKFYVWINSQYST